jgi:NADH-quinone oxidoreductase subunit G
VTKTGGKGSFRVNQGPEAPLPGVEDLALRADRAANATGATMFGFARADAPLSSMQAGDVLVVADEELRGRDGNVIAAKVADAAAVIVVGTSLPAWAQGAEVVLPIANMAEEDGTFTNLRGRVQRFLQAKAAPGLARPSWFVLGDLLAAVGAGESFFVAADVFAAIAAERPEFAGMSYDELGMRGMTAAAAAEPAEVAS